MRTQLEDATDCDPIRTNPTAGVSTTPYRVLWAGMYPQQSPASKWCIAACNVCPGKRGPGLQQAYRRLPPLPRQSCVARHATGAHALQMQRPAIPQARIHLQIDRNPRPRLKSSFGGCGRGPRSRSNRSPTCGIKALRARNPSA
eukprot:365287-Chlamydomonas_euryale.AAC.2